MDKYTFYLIVFLSLVLLPTRSFGQQISGVVLDAYSNAPIPQVEVTFVKGGINQNTNTDVNGKYSIQLPAPGRYNIQLKRDQYQTTIIPAIQINNGSNSTLQHVLKPTAFEIETVIVKANDTWSPINQLQIEVIGIEQTERIAANFQDPARIANSYAGVVQLNDQANHLSIRGLSPLYSKWYLEGMEMVNPNHLSNAGTLSDQPTQAGGGVNLFPAQVLGNTILAKGSQPVEYSNALGGLLDLRYRKPDPTSFKFTSNLSLIGLDFKAEAPITKDGVNTIMANYRYSTVGLLSSLGVPFGDEDIQYQDLHLMTDFKLGDKSGLQAFVFYGNNSNDFLGERDTALWETQKDRFDINFDNEIIGGGFRFRSLVGQSSVLNIGALYSQNESTRNAKFHDELNVNQSQFFSFTKTISSFVNYQSKLNNKANYAIGLQYQLLSNEKRSARITPTPTILSGKKINNHLRPYISLTYQLNKNLSIYPSLAASYWANTEDLILEPGLVLHYLLGDKFDLIVSYQLKSQDIFLPIQEEINPPSIPFFDRPVNAGHFELSGQYKFANYSSLKMALFNTRITNAPVYGSGLYYAQLFDDLINETVTFSGIERNYGAELSYQFSNATGTYFNANATLYKAQIFQSDKWESSRFDGNYIFNLQLGKEFNKQKKKHVRTIGVSARFTYLGGLKERSIDVEGSLLLNETVYESTIYSNRLSNYFRPDISFYILKNKQRSTQRLYLDIQNVASVMNEGYNYFDVVQQGVLTSDQLGIIPILGWQVEF